MSSSSVSVKKLEKLLQTYFGYDSFRSNQLEIITSVLSGDDTLAVMPTGGGKSLCYQIPSLVFSGLTVVVSPLIALMQDQVAQLEKVGIPSLLLNSSLSWNEYCANMELVRSGEIKLLYCAPETLVTDRIQELLSGVRVDCITIDEAHCISEWGHDFRPEYRRLANIRKHFSNAVCLALTATATVNVRSDIKKSLSMPAKCAEFISSFNRPNIFLDVVSKTGSPCGLSSSTLKKLGFKSRKLIKLSHADELVLSFIAEHRNESGIIYCFSRRQVDELSSKLSAFGIENLPYHAGLSDIQRFENQMFFVKDKVPVIVATVAFGMGINKSNVRYVIHYDLPKSLEQYYQEIGRAGRDGKKAHALLLYSFGDVRKIRFFFEEKIGKDLEIAEMQLQAMIDYAQSTKCRREVLLLHFGETYIPELSNSTLCDLCIPDCDVCAEGKGVDIDMTIPSQKILSCIVRTGERYGASYVIDILLGSRQKRIIENGHNKLSTWGIGKDYSKADWFNLVQLLIEAGFLKKSSDYSVLSLTNDAVATLKERGPVFLPFKSVGR